METAADMNDDEFRNAYYRGDAPEPDAPGYGPGNSDEVREIMRKRYMDQIMATPAGKLNPDQAKFLRQALAVYGQRNGH